jgi:hypothetical protein
MHVMTRDEIQRMRVVTDTPDKASTATVAGSPPAAAAAPQPARLTNGIDVSEISERMWSVVDHSGSAALARRHPLTIEGDEIGGFDLLVSCNGSRDSYDALYIEHRQDSDEAPLPQALKKVRLQAAGLEATLKVVSSKHQDDDLVSIATGSVPAALVDGFGAEGNHSMLVKTNSDRVSTTIRLGNTGVAESLPQLAKACRVGAPQKSAQAHPTAVAAK